MMIACCRMLVSAVVFRIVMVAASAQDQPIIEDRPMLVPNAYGPADELRGFAFSPDSRRLFAAGFGKVVNTWDVRVQENGLLVPTFTGDLRWTISRGNRGRINFNSLATSSAGDLLAMAGSGAVDPYGNVVMYNTATRQIQHTLTGHNRPIVSLDFSPNGQRLVSVDETGRVIVCDKSSNWNPQELRSAVLQDGQHQPAIFLDDETVAVSEPVNANPAMQDLSRWQIVLYEIGPPIRKIGVIEAVHGNRITALVRGENGTWGSADEVGRVYVGRGNAEPRLLRFYTRIPLSLAFGPGGTLAICNSRFYDRKVTGDSVLELWDTNAVDRKTPIFQKSLGTAQDAYTVAISPDKTILATHDADTNDLLLFRIADQNGRLLPEPLANPARISGRGHRVDRVSFRKSPEPTDYSLGISYERGGELTKLFRLNPPNPDEAPGLSDAAGILQAEWRGPDTSAGSWSISPDPDDRLKFILTNRGGLSETVALQEEQGWFRCHCFLPDQNGRPFAVAIGTERKNGIFVYALPQPNQPPRLLRYFRDHSGHVTSLSCSEDGRYLVSGSEDQTVKIWSLNGLSEGSPMSQAWGADFEVRGDQLVVSDNPNRAGIAFGRSMRGGDVVKSLVGYDDNGKKQQAATSEDMLRLLYELPVYRQKLLVLERNGQIVQNPEDFTGQGFRLIVAGWEPLLTLYIDRNSEWAVFTPQGYFDSSVADGGDLFGWHINRRRVNPNQELTPRFLKGSNLQKEMERPEVIRRVLQQGNVDDALQAANEPVPDDFQQHVSAIVASVPRVQVTRPLASEMFPAGAAIQVEAQVVYPAGQQSDGFEVRATATGRFLGDPVRNPNPATGGETLTWTATAQGNSEWIAVSVHENGVGTARLFDEDKVFVRLGADDPTDVSVPYKLHILAMSSQEYQFYAYTKLDFPNNDVKFVINNLQDKSNDFYQIGMVRKIQDDALTHSSLDTAISDLRNEITDITEKSTVTQLLLVFVAGHGVVVDDVFYYLPTSLSSNMPAKQKEEGIPWEKMNELTDLGIQTIFLLDTCKAGKIVKSQLRPLAQRGCIVVAAAGEGMDAVEGQGFGGGHGAFTWSFLQGLDGKADDLRDATGSSRSAANVGVPQDQIVTINELIQFILGNVPEMTRDTIVLGADPQKPCYTPKPDEYPDLFARKLVKVRSPRGGN